MSTEHETISQWIEGMAIETQFSRDTLTHLAREYPDLGLLKFITLSLAAGYPGTAESLAIIYRNAQ